MPMDDAIKELEQRIAALELRMDLLTAKRPSAVDPVCALHGCSYFIHYLENYQPARCGEKLDHAQFHAAEGCCEAVQAQCDAWLKAHVDGQLPDYLTKRARYWEDRCAY